MRGVQGYEMPVSAFRKERRRDRGRSERGDRRLHEEETRLALVLAPRRIGLAPVSPAPDVANDSQDGVDVPCALRMNAGPLVLCALRRGEGEDGTNQRSRIACRLERRGE